MAAADAAAAAATTRASWAPAADWNCAQPGPVERRHRAAAGRSARQPADSGRATRTSCGLALWKRKRQWAGSQTKTCWDWRGETLRHSPVPTADGRLWTGRWTRNDWPKVATEVATAGDCFDSLAHSTWTGCRPGTLSADGQSPPKSPSKATRATSRPPA